LRKVNTSVLQPSSQESVESILELCLTSAVNDMRPFRLGDEPLAAVGQYLCNQSEAGFE